MPRNQELVDFSKDEVDMFTGFYVLDGGGGGEHLPPPSMQCLHQGCH